MKYTLLITLSLLIAACTSNNEPAPEVDCSNIAPTFGADVAPIIASSCSTSSGCHGNGSLRGPGPLLNHAQVFEARKVIRAAVLSGEMPQGNTLSAQQKNNIICWIDAGAANN
ncbi:MAG: hypothetical protein ACOYXA_01140 [Bacteroidota bacterium]